MADKPKMCSFCDSNISPYCCPRCGRSYCSSKCYRHSEHMQCSEAFYRECIIDSLKEGECDEDRKSDSKRKMYEILRRIRDKEELDSDDDELAAEQQQDGDEEQVSILERKLLNVNLEEPDVDINRIWNELTPKEREEIESALDNENISDLIPIWKPWWLCKDKEKLVREINEKEVSRMPDIPKEIVPLASLTSVLPSPYVVYNLINILGVYVFMGRRYNGDYGEMYYEAAPFAIKMSKSMLKHQNFSSVWQSFRCIKEQWIEFNETASNKELVTVMDDVSQLLEGPSSQRSTDFVIAALTDLLNLLNSYKSDVNNKLEMPLLYSVDRKQIKMAIKKLEYLISWTSSVEKLVLNSLIPQIRFEIASLIEEDISFKATEDHLLKNPVKDAKVLIEEIK